MSNVNNTVEVTVVLVDSNLATNTTDNIIEGIDQLPQGKTAKVACFSPIPDTSLPVSQQKQKSSTMKKKGSTPKPEAAQVSGSSVQLPLVAEVVSETLIQGGVETEPFPEVQPLSTTAVDSILQEAEAATMAAEPTSWTDQVEQEKSMNQDSILRDSFWTHLEADGNIELFLSGSTTAADNTLQEEIVQSECKRCLEYIPTMFDQICCFSTKLHAKRYAQSVGLNYMKTIACASFNNLPHSFCVGSVRAYQILKDEAVDTVLYLNQIHRETVGIASHVKVVGQAINAIRQEASSVPSYTHVTQSSSTKVAHAPARESTPMDTSEGSTPTAPSKGYGVQLHDASVPAPKQVYVVSPATSPSPTLQPAPFEKKVKQKKKKSSALAPLLPPPHLMSGWLEHTQGKKKPEQQSKAKAQAEVEEIVSPAVQGQRSGASNKCARLRSPGSSMHPNILSTLPPSAKKPCSEASVHYLEDLKCGYANIDMELLSIIPADVREEAVRAQGRKIWKVQQFVAAQGSSSTQTGWPGCLVVHCCFKPKAVITKNKGNAPFKGITPLGRQELSSLNDVVTKCLCWWEKLDTCKNKQLSLEQSNNQCMHSEWAVSTSMDLNLKFMYQVADEFLTWLEETM
ncbi:hypothetical protein BDY19DRAFT_910438 [Irpex rosettiformis]|uniref:Uncharacterized protein n=1 Tax=Irpex rosettiformis TaxID=378272 RepID=A0ACB8TNR0_9APHY|nr:hypothetical protein BDY19DRAFT_910438 [Irpex rosettiformis]